MANLKSAIKRIRKIQRQNVVNRLRKGRFKRALKKMNSLVESKRKKEALIYSFRAVIGGPPDKLIYSEDRRYLLASACRHGR